MLLAVDIGNTRVKWGLFDDDGLIKSVACMHSEILHNETQQSIFIEDAKKCRKAMVANVAADKILQTIKQLLAQAGAPCHIAETSAEACGVVNGYENPKKLGIDRWATVIAAYKMAQESAVIVNAGTAITVDSLVIEPESESAEFSGGMIMPGIALMQQSLHQYTGLPLANKGQMRAMPTDTEDAIMSGVLNAAVGAIRLACQSMAMRVFKAPKVILTGGDALKLLIALKFYAVDAQVADDLVLYGLNQMARELH